MHDSCESIQNYNCCKLFNQELVRAYAIADQKNAFFDIFKRVSYGPQSFMSAIKYLYGITRLSFFISEHYKVLRNSR